MARSLQKATIAFLITLLAIAGLTFSPAPNASAQDAPAALSPYARVAVGAECPDGTSLAGTIIGSPFGGQYDGTYCAPNGFVPLRDADICNAIDPNVKWVDEGSLPGVCAYDGWSLPSGGNCPAPTAKGEGLSSGGVFATWCLFQVLTEGGDAGQLSAGLPVCIETSFVAEAAPDGQVGTQFRSDGVRYLIHTGAPTCEANCHMGFDFNCDDKLGDYCPAGLDLDTVAGIQECTAALAGPAVEAVSADVVADDTALPAVIPISAPAAPSSGLAHTGSESTLLAYVGLGLVGFGATALGMRRRFND